MLYVYKSTHYGGTVSIYASSNSGHSCVCFEFTFGAGAGDAWAYPQLLVKNLSVGTLKERDPEPDGIRVFISGVHSQPAIGAIKDVNSIFFDRNGTQFMLPLQVNTSESIQGGSTSHCFSKTRTGITTGLHPRPILLSRPRR